MSGPFNKKNFFGKHCIWAFIPGWYDFEFTASESASNTGDHAYVASVGQHMVFADYYGSINASTAKIVTKSQGHLGKVRCLNLSQASRVNHVKLRYSLNDTGILFPNDKSLTILSIVRPDGTGRPGDQGDPRIISKDLGSSTNDHDLMIGLVNSSGVNPRCRIRIGATTQTILDSTSTVQQDALNLIAGGIYQYDATNQRGWVAHLREDGTFSSTDSGTSVTSTYNPRTTTDIAIGANAGAADNSFDGDIIGVWAFDISLYANVDKTEHLFREFFKNPWQVFAPRRTLVPMIAETTFVAVEPVEPQVGPILIFGGFGA